MDSLVDTYNNVKIPIIPVLENIVRQFPGKGFNFPREFLSWEDLSKTICVLLNVAVSQFDQTIRVPPKCQPVHYIKI